MATVTPISGPDRDRRLNGWKEIAAHFGKGVRTVQRWEKELGMPVHRLAGGRSESVTAFTRELDDWWRRARFLEISDRETADDPHETRDEAPQATAATDEKAPLPSPTPRNNTNPARRFALVAAAVILLALAGAAWLWFSRAPNPVSWRVEHGKIHLYAEDGALAWEAPLAEPISTAPGQPMPKVVLADLEGDGSTEVLIGRRGTESSSAHLLCFDASGRRRFDFSVNRVARFGDVEFRGPWDLHLLAVTDRPGKPGKHVWAAFNSFNLFPSVLVQLAPSGEVTGEYWSNGNIDDVKAFAARGEPRVLVTAANNDFRSASLVVLDPAHPTATAPARQHEYTCTSCPAARPLEFLVFPTTDIEQAQQAESFGTLIVSPGRGVTVHLRHDASALLGEPERIGVTYYNFDENLVPTHAEREPQFKIVFDELFRKKIVDHPFGAAEQASVWPMLRWTPTGFEEIRPR